MGKKVTSWKTQGMNKDLSVSAFNEKFAFENLNLRLSTNEGNTMMSWVTEKGPLALSLKNPLGEDFSLSGIPIGTAVLNHKLVLFTTNEEEDKPDHIYVLEYIDDAKTSMRVTQLFNGNLNFNTDYPLETLVSYEAEHIQKVYWTDGLNQPRLINIANIEKLQKWNEASGVQDFFFDFVPSINFSRLEVTIEKNIASVGIFAPGIIQYCFTYVNKYGQESNIIWCSSLYYLAHSDRGASPEETVSNSFTIQIKNTDTNFDYVRLYSIQRVNIDGEPSVRCVIDIATSNEDIVYTDNGIAGYTVDPYTLLYVGGKEITALTMADKDNTLFLGNIKEPNTLVNDIQDYFDSIRNTDKEMKIEFENNNNLKKITLDHSYSVYSHTNMLNDSLRKISTFKGGETYRFGFQLQKRTGEWTEPIFLNDATNTKYPQTNIYQDVINLTDAKATINFSEINSYLLNLNGKGFDYSTYKKIRPVIVYPKIGERSVLCQGVLNPTVFNAMDRIDNSPFAQASWFFRPYMTNEELPKKHVDIRDSVTIITGTYNSSLSIDPTPLSGYDYPTEKVYTLIADLTDTSKIDTILERGTIIFSTTKTTTYGGSSSRTVTSNTSYEFGAIDLGNNRYAFFSKIPWEREGSNTSGSTTITYKYQEGVNVVFIEENQTENNAPDIYTDIRKTKESKNLYYYVKSNFEASDTYVFWFHDNNTSYTVTFNSIGTASDSDYTVIKDNLTGSALRYIHYNSLYSAKEAGEDTDLLRAVEIQGSVGANESPIYSSVESNSISGVRRRGSGLTGVDVSAASNTQFFIDQSIVTLNSPDLEFDTAVQTYGTEGLKLRIIGAIPITATISTHEINISSSMLETLHNNSDDRGIKRFGAGEIDENIIHENIDINAGKRLVTDYLWNDIFTEKYEENEDKEDRIKTKGGLYNYPIYPWHRIGSLNNDTRNGSLASSMLNTKRESSLLYSINTEYFTEHNLTNLEYENLSTKFHLTENASILNIRLPRQKDSSSEINYYPNIDKILYNKDGYNIIVKEEIEEDEKDKERSGGRVVSDSEGSITSPISMRYKSTTHAIIALNADDVDSPIPLLPYGIVEGTDIGKYSNPQDDTEKYEAFWGDTNMKFSQKGVNMKPLFNYINNPTAHNFLWIGELYKDVINQFGGTTKEALRTNVWLVAGETKEISEEGALTLYWLDGDTYYQRYDCMKTYAFTDTDPNQLVEILSFMCETHMNIDGRYDKNRGQINNYYMSPTNFNLLNTVYSQQNNFFTSRISDTKGLTNLTFPNQVYYSKTKTSGADVDLYTNITLSSMLELDGDKGEISVIRRLNNQLLAFQDTGVSQILYNENAQISTTNGVPIELANSGKVQGKRYISDTIGCSNKWALTLAPTGIYFMDSYDKSIYLYNGQFLNISIQGGFNSWTKNNIPSPDILWTPNDFDNFVAYYDKLNQDILFINHDISLAYSEKLGTFTSFYDYGGTPYLCNFEDTGIWIRSNGSIYRHNAGDYCNFFGINKPYSMVLVGNPEPQLDKIFTNLEFRATTDGEGVYDENTGKFTPYLPFDKLNVWNEYQHGIAYLQNKNGNEAMQHHLANESASLKRKFRIWRCDIPRDNAELSEDKGLNITRFKKRPIDRMRNPWIYLKLIKEAADKNSALSRTEIHDIIMTYFA